MNRTVLIVEDDEDVRDALSEFFTDKGFESRTAWNGRDALDVLASMPSLPCFIVLDFMMPVMDGGAFLEAQRADVRLRAIPVALLSAHMHLWRKEVGTARHVLTKPIDRNALLQLASGYCA